MILVCIGFAINGSFLNDYYQKRKVEAMLDAYSEINVASNAGTIDSKEFDLAFRTICEKNNVDIIIRDSASDMLKVSTGEYESMANDLMDYVFGLIDMSKDSLLAATPKYEIHKVAEPQYEVEYLDLWGILDNGNIFLIRSPLTGLNDSVQTARTFFNYLYAFLVAFVIAGIVIYSRSATISQLKAENESLEKSIRQKEELENMRNEFLTNVSHELKTPLALIQGYSEGLKENINSDEESRNFYCDVIIDEAMKMDGMVKRLLDLNHLEFGDTEFKFEYFDIVDVIQSYLENMSVIAEQKGISVSFEHPQRAVVYSDEYYVEEVFGNYFSNALNYVSQDGRINVRIVADDTSKKITVSVFNTGDLIPKESIEHIWDKFYKVDKARTREYGGNGVGLSIVKAILTAMNEEYGVRNCSDGVEFYFTLRMKGISDGTEEND